MQNTTKPQSAANNGQGPLAVNSPVASEEHELQAPAACSSTTAPENIGTPEERAHRTLSWEKLHDALGIKIIPSLDDLKRSASKIQIEDPEFTAMDSDARIRTYWADFRGNYRHKTCSECGITDRELSLLDDLMGCWRSGPFGFASSADLAARLNARRAKEVSPVASNADAIGGVSAEEIGTLLERLFMQAGGKDWYQVDSTEIERKFVEQTDANGQPVPVLHYRFSDSYNWDYLELEELEIELIDRLIEMNVIVRTAPGRWVNKHTGEEAI